MGSSLVGNPTRRSRNVQNITNIRCLDKGERRKKLIVLIANTQTRPAVRVRQSRVIALEKRPILISFHVFQGA